jgi:putative oxidoreductase
MDRSQDYGALVLRLALGTMFLTHAGLKYFVFTMPGSVQFFQSVGLPGALAYFTVAGEVVGGTLILLGAYGRWASAALIPVLLGALWVHAGNGWVFTAPNGGWEYPAFLAAAALAHVLIGDGAYALVNPQRAHKLRQEVYA